MKKTIKLLCTWAASLLLAGCSSEADMEKLMDWQSNPDAVHFTASVNNATTRTNPAATDDAQTKFKENDQVTVSNNGNQANYAYDGTSWAPAEANKYLLWDRSNLTFNCWYPAGGNNTATVGYLNKDQSSAELMAKSDYMNAEKTLKSADDPLNFSLVRKTARIILKISGFTDVSGNIKHVLIVSKASTAADETQTIDIRPFAQNGESEIGGIGTTYTALVIPGEVVAKFYFTDDMSDAKPLTMTTNVTAAGSSYIYNLNVIKRTKIEVIGITKGAWTASGTTTGDLICYPYVTFTAEQPQTFKMIAQEGYKISGLEYSVKNGEWNDVVADKVVEFGGDKGDLRLRGKNNQEGTSGKYGGYSQISFGNTDVNVECTGDIRTLLDYENYETVATGSARFYRLFKDCTQLTSAPNLPAKTLADGGYQEMFRSCTSLTAAPDLPATKLADLCYANMFDGCTKLNKVPDALPAITMASNCYLKMFYKCTSLTAAPDLPATTLAKGCYDSMFWGCEGLTEAPKLNATPLKELCYNAMFWGCTSLTAAPDLPATTLAKNCYAVMFRGCTSLETGPEKLPALKLATRCYDSMFLNCSSLQTAPELPATELAEACYINMFNGCKKVSSVKMTAPSDQITGNYFSDWLSRAGKDVTTGRTLIVNDQTAYDALLKTTDFLPTNWRVGNCTVTAADGSNIK